MRSGWLVLLSGMAGCDHLFLLQHIDPPPREAGIDAMSDDATDVLLPPGAIVAAGAGTAHTCAVAGGFVRCWGFGTLGRLGYADSESIGDDELPSDAGNVDVGGAVVEIGAGDAHTCVRLGNGTIRCWGAAGSGQLGTGTTNTVGDTETPASIDNIAVGGTASALAVGSQHTCVITGEGVRCWGHAGTGQLGYGNLNNIGDTEAPNSVGTVMIGNTVATAIAAGGNHTCIITAGERVMCWGYGGSGQLG